MAAAFPRRLSRRGVIRLGALVLGVLAVALPGRRLAGPARAAGDGRWVCTDSDCDPYVYDPARGDPDNINNPGHPVPPGTRFEDLPDDWICPFCGSGKAWFRPFDR